MIVFTPEGLQLIGDAHLGAPTLLNLEAYKADGAVHLVTSRDARVAPDVFPFRELEVVPLQATSWSLEQQHYEGLGTKGSEVDF